VFWRYSSTISAASVTRSFSSMNVTSSPGLNKETCSQQYLHTHADADADADTHADADAGAKDHAHSKA
jgi:hypothetical protein